jgi:peptidoglycan/LPS O-acetylase OafA/YrhL
MLRSQGRPRAVAAPFAGERLGSEAALRGNWLNAFRLGFAVLVLFSHCYPVTRGSDETEPLSRWTGGQVTFGGLAVNAFFLISGFLIVRSWEQTRSMSAYFRHRVLRIHPGFAVALVVSLLLAMAASAEPWEYLRTIHWRELAVGVFTLGFGMLDNAREVFPHNPLAGVVNASLWTIRLEFFAYIGVAVYGLFGLFRFRKAWAGVMAFVLAVYGAKILRDGQADAWWRLGCFFAVGASFYLWRDFLPRSRALLVGAIAVIVVGAVFKPWLNLVLPVAGGWWLFHSAFARVPARVLGWFKTDLSYGVYLYAFPIQQWVVHLSGWREPWAVFWAAMPLTLGFAWLSWTFVERPMLGWKSRSFGDGEPVAERAGTRVRA